MWGCRLHYFFLQLTPPPFYSTLIPLKPFIVQREHRSGFGVGGACGLEIHKVRSQNPRLAGRVCLEEGQHLLPRPEPYRPSGWGVDRKGGKGREKEGGKQRKENRERGMGRGKGEEEGGRRRETFSEDCIAPLHPSLRARGSRRSCFLPLSEGISFGNVETFPKTFCMNYIPVL